MNEYTNNILYIVNTATCFTASASSSGVLNLYFAKVNKIIKIIELKKFN